MSDVLRDDACAKCGHGPVCHSRGYKGAEQDWTPLCIGLTESGLGWLCDCDGYEPMMPPDIDPEYEAALAEWQKGVAPDA